MLRSIEQRPEVLAKTKSLDYDLEDVVFVAYANIRMCYVIESDNEHLQTKSKNDLYAYQRQQLQAVWKIYLQFDRKFLIRFFKRVQKRLREKTKNKHSKRRIRQCKKALKELRNETRRRHNDIETPSSNRRKALW